MNCLYNFCVIKEINDWCFLKTPTKKERSKPYTIRRILFSIFYVSYLTSRKEYVIYVVSVYQKSKIIRRHDVQKRYIPYSVSLPYLYTYEFFYHTYTSYAMVSYYLFDFLFDYETTKKDWSYPIFFPLCLDRHLWYSF